jgi:CheY-like chemotaxis protein
VIETPSILITDDDPVFRDTVCGVLEPDGFRTIVASSGEEACEIIQSEEVHVALFDIHMPRLTGLETLRLVKQFKALLPVILMSARLDETIRAEAEREAAFAVLAKPVSRFDLTNSVQQALHRTYGWS